MNRVRISRNARFELDQIVEYLAEVNPRAANAWIDLFERTLDLLADAPDIGRPRDDLRPGIRSLTVGRYLLFYRHGPNEIEIARIIHGNRDLWRIFHS